MVENKGLVTAEGNPLTLQGEILEVGKNMPDCTLLDNDMQPVNLSSFLGKKLIIASVPSLDTPVCDMETRRFNTEAAALGDDVVILTVSMDLPFAQKRWCGAAGVEAVKTFSDHREASFGEATGTLIKELRLLARAIFVVGEDGKIAYLEYVGDITHEPDYDAALSAIKSLE